MTEHLIVTTMRPGQPISVTDEELVDLQRMGVVAGFVPTELDQVPAPTPLVGKEEQTGESPDDGEEGQPEDDGAQEAPAAEE